jgi:hypothetical protein
MQTMCFRQIRTTHSPLRSSEFEKNIGFCENSCTAVIVIIILVRTALNSDVNVSRRDIKKGSTPCDATVDLLHPAIAIG